jgi:hypothetical protein
VSDISKKVFSIEPDSDEQDVTRIPDLPEDQADTDKSRHVILRLRPAKSLSNAGAASHIELVENKDDAATTPLDPINEAISFITDDTPPEEVKAAIKAHHDRIDAAVPLSPARITPPHHTPVEYANSPGWVGPVLALTTGISIALLIYVLSGSDAARTPLGLVAIGLGAVIPMTAVMALWASLQSQKRNRFETQQLATLADRLTRADKTVSLEVETLASAIRRELSTVDSRLAQTRNEIETLAAIIERQSAETDGMARRMTERNEAISEMTGAQRAAFSDLTDTIDAQLKNLSEHVSTHGQSLSNASEATFLNIVEATRSLDKIIESTAERTQQIKVEAGVASDALLAAESKLSTLTQRMSSQVEDIEKIFEMRARQIDALASRVSDEKIHSQDALSKQSDLLKAVDAQIDMAEARLSQLLDQAQSVQDQMASRLTDLEDSLGEADRRAREYTSNVADRVEESMGQTRRELSIMESEVRALKSRLADIDNAPSASQLAASPLTLSPLTDAPDSPQSDSGSMSAQDPNDRQGAKNAVESQSGQDSLAQNDSGAMQDATLDAFSEADMSLQAFDDLAIPEIEDEADDISSEFLQTDMTEPVLAPTDEPIFAAPDEPELIRRPGDVTDEAVRAASDPESERRAISFPDKNWRWRDMLGSLDPASPPARQDEKARQDKKEGQSRRVERPGPGVPLPPPQDRPAVLDAPDVIQRLCEVKLPPDTVVKDVVIQQAAAARRAGGEAAQSSTVFTHLNSPVIHLRGVLSADAAFRQRVETFRRDFNHDLDGLSEPALLQSALASQTGRAYLLCAAALFAE